MIDGGKYLTNKSLMHFGIVAIIILLIVGGCSVIESNNKEKAEKDYQHNSDKYYQQGITLIKDRKYYDAAMLFDSFKDQNYKNATILYMYAIAESKKTSDPSMTRDYLKEIPENYVGEFAIEIKVLREFTKEGAEKQREADREVEKDRQKERASKIYIGDSDDKVTQLLGKPTKKNRTVTGNAVSEQWVYGNGRYVYIEDGIVTSWQD